MTEILPGHGGPTARTSVSPNFILEPPGKRTGERLEINRRMAYLVHCWTLQESVRHFHRDYKIRRAATLRGALQKWLQAPKVLESGYSAYDEALRLAIEKFEADWGTVQQAAKIVRRYTLHRAIGAACAEMQKRVRLGVVGGVGGLRFPVLGHMEDYNTFYVQRRKNWIWTIPDCAQVTLGFGLVNLDFSKIAWEERWIDWLEGYGDLAAITHARLTREIGLSWSIAFGMRDSSGGEEEEGE